MKISINDYVYVKLTEFGEKVLFNYWFKILYQDKNFTDIAIKNHIVENKNYYKFQLHDFMIIFGNHIDLANQNSCFKNNEILTNEKDLK